MEEELRLKKSLKLNRWLMPIPLLGGLAFGSLIDFATDYNMGTPFVGTLMLLPLIGALYLGLIDRQGELSCQLQKLQEKSGELAGGESTASKAPEEAVTYPENESLWQLARTGG